MKHSDFVHLHLHTQYSLLDGAIRHDDLFRKAREYKMPAVAMTDHGNMFGAVEFYEKALKHGVKPIIGCEVYVAGGSRFEKDARRKGEKPPFYHLILLVKNQKGYRNLCKLVTSGFLEGFYYKPRIDKELLREYNEGLIALSACLHGEIAYHIQRDSMEQALDIAAEYMTIFSDRRFFLELQDNGIEEQRTVNRKLVEIGRQLGIPLVATNDCHYLNRNESKAHDILLCIQTGKNVDDSERLKFSTNEFYFKSPEEMSLAFADLPEAVSNTIEVAERCNIEFELGVPKLPDFDCGDNEDVDEVLEKLTRDGLNRRFKRILSSDNDKWRYLERLERELKIIKAMGFSGYFLIVADLISYSRRRGIPVGPGRGSAAGSLVAFSLGITNIDPLSYNLLFERFLNPDRVSLPDIDMDFCYEGREEVIKYVTEKYGRDNVSQIITFGQMKARAAIRDVGRALNMNYGSVDRIAKMIPQILNITIDNAINQEPRLKGLIESDKKVEELVTIAKSLEGLTRHASTHAAGIVISNRPLIEYLPLYRGSKHEITTQYAMKEVEKIGLVKFDFLGLKTLTVMDKAMKLVKKIHGVDIYIDDIPLDDMDAYNLIGKGSTNGVFQFESSGMKEILCKLKPDKFDDLIAAVALHRPGPIRSGMVDDFIKRRHGQIPARYELPQLKGILENTYGVMLYQEQVMEIAKVLASYTPGDADILRKAMGKKLDKEMLEQRNKFLAGTKKNKISETKAGRIFDLMAKFAGYGFNKSHSAAYALIAYQTAYLKVHFPVEFMSALLTADMGDSDKIIKYIGECREMGIAVLPPDVNESDRDFTVSSGKIRFGLAAVKNVGASAIENIICVRGEGRFDSFIDFLENVDLRRVNKKVVESLIKCGAFDFTEQARAQLMVSMDQAIAAANETQKNRESGQIAMFDSVLLSTSTERSLESTVSTDWTEKERLAFEKESLGFYITGHPLMKLMDELKFFSDVNTETVKDKENDTQATIGGIIAATRKIKTKKGKTMAFVNLEDMNGNIEVVIFAALYDKVSELLDSTLPLIVEGRVDRDEHRVKIVASDIFLMKDASGRLKKKVHIMFDAKRNGSEQLRALKEVISSNSGNAPVFLHISGDCGETIIALPENLQVLPSSNMVTSVKLISSDIDVRVLQ